MEAVGLAGAGAGTGAEAGAETGVVSDLPAEWWHPYLMASLLLVLRTRKKLREEIELSIQVFTYQRTKNYLRRRIRW